MAKLFIALAAKQLSARVVYAQANCGHAHTPTRLHVCSEKALMTRSRGLGLGEWDGMGWN